MCRADGPRISRCGARQQNNYVHKLHVLKLEEDFPGRTFETESQLLCFDFQLLLF